MGLAGDTQQVCVYLMAAGDLLLNSDGELILDADGDLGIHDGVTDECCCGEVPPGCCICGACTLTESPIDACLVLTVTIYGNEADCLAQTNPVATTHYRYSNLDGDGVWNHKTILDGAGADCGEWWLEGVDGGDINIRDFAGTAGEACVACNNAAWATANEVPTATPPLRIRRNCTSGKWEFYAVDFGDDPNAWREIGTGTCDGITGSVEACSFIDPDWYHWEWCWSISGAEC